MLRTVFWLRPVPARLFWAIQPLVRRSWYIFCIRRLVSCSKHSDGRWEGRYTIGRDPETGKLIYRNVLARTQTECKTKLREAGYLIGNRSCCFCEHFDFYHSRWISFSPT